MGQILEKISYEDFKAFQKEWLVNGRTLWFIYGNLTSKTAVQIVEEARTSLNLKTVPKDQLPTVRCVMLDDQDSRIHFEVEDKKNENSCLSSYFQSKLQTNSHTSMLNAIVE